MIVTSDRDHVNTPSWREVRGVWGGGGRLSDLPAHAAPLNLLGASGAHAGIPWEAKGNNVHGKKETQATQVRAAPAPRAVQRRPRARAPSGTAGGQTRAPP